MARSRHLLTLALSGRRPDHGSYRADGSWLLYGSAISGNAISRKGRSVANNRGNKIPAHTNRAHLEQKDGRCDTVTVLNMATQHKKDRHGQVYADMNACALKDGDANVHWADGPFKNHYDHLATVDEHGRETRREMTEEEKHRPVAKWTTEEFLRWRRGKSGGPRPFTVAMRQKQAADLDVVICWELKSRLYQSAKRAERFVKAVEDSNHKAYYMTLVTMAAWGPKLKAFKEAGGQTALLPHNARKTPTREARLEIFKPHIDRYWGNWAKE
jgi:hypothetical protein